MVGFGSSLRMCRREGWPYIAYEDLKLLLSEIESVYEENITESTRARETATDGAYYDAYDGLNYFENNDFLLQNYNAQSKTRRTQQAGQRKNRAPSDFRDELFWETDSSLAFASSPSPSNSSDNDEEINYKEQSKQTLTDNHSKNKGILPNDGFSFSYDSASYSPTEYGSFVTGGPVNTIDIPHENTFEKNPLLQAHTKIKSNERDIQGRWKPLRFFGKTSSGKGVSRKSRRLHEREKRRRAKKKRRWKKRRKGEHPCLRFAHEKARGITERFLGLLRAEVDKILLFTYSRMGTLADTIGSLRFPDDDTANIYHGTQDRQDDHTFGFHSSSSSSSDDIDSISWSESEGDDSSREMPLASYRRQRQHKLNQQDDISISQKIPSDYNIRSLNNRGTRPVFQTSDHIVGEDLLLSAVDEADAFTAVGVEYLHLLKYISINLLAIRKICKKHDRLLDSRMLGGYYHKRAKIVNNGVVDCRDRVLYHKDVKYSQLDEPVGEVLWNVTARLTDENGKNQPEHNQNKLVGVYDVMIQKIANSPTSLAISESLALALSEYEISHRRADALTKLNAQSAGSLLSAEDEDLTCNNFLAAPKAFGWSYRKAKAAVRVDKLEDAASGDEGYEYGGEPSSTTSIASLNRLRFVVASVLGLREIAKIKAYNFKQFLARSMIAVNTDSTPVGECGGLNGISRETLNFFVSFNPDSALRLDTQTINNSLLLETKKSDSVDVSDAMLSCLEASADLTGQGLAYSGVTISSGLSTYVRRKSCYLRIQTLLASTLSTMNYYIIVPSAAAFCQSLGGKHAHSFVLIGAGSVLPLLSMIYHMMLVLNDSKKRLVQRRNKIRLSLAIGAILSIIGNLTYSLAYDFNSILVAVLSRLVLGYSSSEFFIKHFLVSIVSTPDEALSSISSMRKSSMLGLFIGILLPTLFLSTNLRITVTNHSIITLNYETAPGYIMAILWFLQFALILCCDDYRYVEQELESAWRSEHVVVLGNSDNNSVDEQSSREHTLKKVYTSAQSTDLVQIHDAKKSEIERKASDKSFALESIDNTTEVLSHPTKPRRTLATSIDRTRTLLLHNIAIPVLSLVIFCQSIIMEMIFSSCPIITQRYSLWPGFSFGGYFMSLLALTVYPIYWLASLFTRYHGERAIMKRSLILLIFGVLSMINYQGLFALIYDLLHRHNSESSMHYDWGGGVVQYCCGMSIIFVCTTVMESVSTNLISKISSNKLNNWPINCALLSPFLHHLGRLVADFFLVGIGFSHRIINTDMVNSISFVILFLCASSFYVIKKHFAWLIMS